MRRTLLNLGLEAIAQQDPITFRELTVIFEEFLAAGVFTTKAINSTSLQKVLLEKKGLTFDITIDEKMQLPGAYVIPPQITKNHPLVADFYRTFTHNRDGRQAILRSEKGYLAGTVDRTKGKVTGDFTKFVSDLTFTAGLFSTNIGMTAAELAAITLHEVGHVFTYFECLGDQLTTNYQIAQVIKELTGTADTVTRMKIIAEAETAMGVKVNNPAELAQQIDRDVIQTIMIESKLRAHRSEFGSYYYDLRNWESLSDQFAARHGSHLALTTALDKLYRHNGHVSTMSTPMFLLGEIFKVVGTVIGSIVMPLFVVILLTQDPLLDTYDRPAERMTRIRQDLVSALKDPALDAKRRACILAELDSIDVVIAKLRDRNTLWESVWKYLSPTIHGQQAKIQDLKALEELANNELYVHAAALRTHA